MLRLLLLNRPLDEQVRALGRLHGGLSSSCHLLCVRFSSPLQLLTARLARTGVGGVGSHSRDRPAPWPWPRSMRALHVDGACTRALRAMPMPHAHAHAHAHADASCA